MRFSGAIQEPLLPSDSPAPDFQFKVRRYKVNILIKNGKIVDGTGSPWFRSDIEIESGRISRIARRIDKKADRTIDASGLVVAPGFIDPHCHNEGPIIFHPEMENDITQGTTTQVFGMCGTSPFPDKATYLDFLSKVYGGDVFWYSKMFAKSTFDWHSLTGFCDLVKDRRPAINVVPFIGLGTMLWKAGYKVTTEAESRKPTREEIAKTKELMRQGFEQGAVGLTTSRDYFPDRYLAAGDYVEPLKVVSEYGRVFMAHTRFLATVDGLREAVRIVQKAGVKFHVSHLNVCPNMSHEDVNRLAECLAIVDTAREEGLDITFDVIQNTSYCYGPGSLIRQLRYFCREWAPEQMEGVESFEKFCKAVASPDYRQKVRDIVVNYAGRAEQYLSGFFARHLDSTILIKTAAPELEGKTLGQIARKQGGDPRDLFFDIAFGLSPIVAESPNLVVIWPFTAGHPNDENVVKATNHPAGMPSSDFPVLATKVEYFYSPTAYGTMPFYYRKAIEYGVRMEEAIRKMTSLPAQVLGLKERGMLREGMKADIVVFDPAELRAAADYYNPTAKAEGIRYVLVNGRVCLDSGPLTNERPGEILYWGCS